MKTDKKEVQQIVDDVEESLEAVEQAVKVLHKRLTAAGKLLSAEADGGITTKATGEGK